MANLPTDQARLMWERYRDSKPRLTQVELGATDRMMKHFRALERYGLKQYIPMNELDIRIKFRRQQGEEGV